MSGVGKISLSIDKEIPNIINDFTKNNILTSTPTFNPPSFSKAELEEMSASVSKAEMEVEENSSFLDEVGEGIMDFLDDVGTTISDGFDSVCDGIENWWSDVEDWWSDDALPSIENGVEAVGDALESTGATIVVAGRSVIEGVGNLGEAVVDLGAMAGSGIVTIGTGIADGVQAIRGLVTGEEWDSLTKQLWNETKAFVSTKHVTNYFDDLYANTEYGKWLKENAYFFDTTRGIGSGLGYTAGIVGVSVLTFGLGGAAIAGTSAAGAGVTAGQLATTAGLAGFSRGTQDAWADGASIGEGLFGGGATGLWEGLQFFVGSKIGNLFGKESVIKGLGSKPWQGQALSSLSKIFLDGVDGGAEGFIQPLIASIYKDGYYDENN